MAIIKLPIIMRLTCSTVSEATANPINCGTTLIKTGNTTMKKAPKKAPKKAEEPVVEAEDDDSEE